MEGDLVFEFWIREVFSVSQSFLAVESLENRTGWPFILQEADLKWIDENIPSSVADGYVKLFAQFKQKYGSSNQANSAFRSFGSVNE